MNITYIYADSLEEWNCSEWRCAIPSRAFRRSKTHNSSMIYLPDFIKNTPEAEEACKEADIIIVQRNLFGPTLTRIQHWQAQGKTVIADFDDAYDLIHPSVKNYKFWMEGKMDVTKEDNTVEEKMISPLPIKQFKWGLRLSHGATVPCRMLAEDWQSFTKMSIVPNYLELAKYNHIEPADNGKKVVIGWGGSLSHLQSFEDSGVLAAIKSACRSRPNVRLMICGDQRVYDRISLPSDKKIYQPFVPALEWPRQIARFDIGIAPLEGEYDKRRSWIKVLEYMIMKVPWIATDYPPYEDLRSYGILVENNPENWYKAIIDMVDHLTDYKHSAETDAYEFAVKQGVDSNLETIAQTYAKIIENAWTE